MWQKLLICDHNRENMSCLNPSNSQESVLRWNERSSSSAPCPEPSEEPRWTWTDWPNKDALYPRLNLQTLGSGFYLVDISKRSLTELTLQVVAPHRSSSCSQSEADSNQFMWASRRRLLRNCFISGGGKLKKHFSRGLNSCQASVRARAKFRRCNRLSISLQTHTKRRQFLWGFSVIDKRTLQPKIIYYH